MDATETVITMPRYTVAYRLHHVDHMDVTVDYPTALDAITEFEKVKEYASLKFVRLECDGETVDYFRGKRPDNFIGLASRSDPGAP